MQKIIEFFQNLFRRPKVGPLEKALMELEPDERRAVMALFKKRANPGLQATGATEPEKNPPADGPRA